MKIRQLFFFLSVLLLFVSVAGLWGQTSSDSTMRATRFDMSGFPQWAKDLRRAEIIAFGSFPFMYLFSNMGHDTYRWSNNNWDNRYAPWPIKGAGAIEQTQEEKLMTLGIAAGGAVLVALIDYSIVRIKRYRVERERMNIPEGTPIIIRTPLYGEAEDAPVPESAFPETEIP